MNIGSNLRTKKNKVGISNIPSQLLYPSIIEKWLKVQSFMIQNHAVPKGKIALIGLSVFIKIILCDLGEILSLSLFFAYEDLF